MFNWFAAPYSWIAEGVLALVVVAAIAGGGAYVAHKLDAAAYQTLETKFADYQTLVAKAEAQTRINDLAAQQKFAAKAQAAVDAANQTAAKAETARAGAAQALSDTLSKEGKADAPLAVCLARRLPADVLSGLTH